ncbi:Uncharacterised protein [Shigella sonnei]|nr:Uncharacterised protein [Shigella sonnei]CSQ66885.1 Uncharacterised protein [Shigella sonnei]CSS69980.1 Uncharacterised protein [Shigella sonnei]
MPHGEFVIERKRLRHIAHPTAGIDIFWINRLPEQPRLTFAGGQQSGEHFHGGGFTAAVRTKKTKNLPAWNAEINVINGNEGTKTHGQIARFDGNLCVFRLIRWDHYRLMRLALRLR